MDSRIIAVEGVLFGVIFLAIKFLFNLFNLWGIDECEDKPQSRAIMEMFCLQKWHSSIQCRPPPMG